MIYCFKKREQKAHDVFGVAGLVEPRTFTPHVIAMYPC